MIISNSRKFVFVHILKAAGTSITQALDPYLAWNDVVLGGTRMGERIQSAYRERFGLDKHSTGEQIKRVVGDELWSEYFTFSFVRHPYSRALSLYKYIRKLVGRRGMERYTRHLPLLPMSRDHIWRWPATRAYLDSRDFSSFIRHPLLRNARSMRPQVHWLTDSSGEPIVDFVGRVENIEEDFSYVTSRLGLEPVSLGVANASRANKDASSLVSDEDAAYLYERFSADFDSFGYDARGAS